MTCTFEIFGFWMTFGNGWKWLKWYSQNCCRLCTMMSCRFNGQMNPWMNEDSYCLVWRWGFFSSKHFFWFSRNCTWSVLFLFPFRNFSGCTLGSQKNAAFVVSTPLPKAMSQLCTATSTPENTGHPGAWKIGWTIPGRTDTWLVTMVIVSPLTRWLPFQMA